MTSLSQAGTRPPARWKQLAMRKNDLRVVQRAGSLITDLGADLDRQLATESRPAERMRMLRETTNRITRIANDAVHAYTRASGAVNAELARPDGDVAAADLRRLLDDARRDVLLALEVARRRYPWTDADADADAD